MKQYDIIVVGEGIIGLTLVRALLTLKFDLKIALISKDKPSTQAPLNSLYDPRVSAITLASERMFKRLLAWDEITQRRVSPFRDLYVWDASGPGKLHFDSALLGLSHLGHIIENSVMLSALQHNLYEHPNLTYYPESQLIELLQPAEGVILKTSTETFFTSLLIGADGANSWVREQAHFKLHQQPYEQTALISQVETQLPHQETAWQCFLPTGPLAFLPLNRAHHSSIVWSCAPDKAQQFLALNEKEFCEQLSIAFEYKLGKVLTATPRLSFPLIRRHVENYVQPHIALAGDAAHTIHPLAGQGLNLGLLDVAQLVDVIEHTLTLGRPLGYLPLLRQYERVRRSENLIMLKSMDVFHQLFSHPSPLAHQLRNQGLNITEKLSWLKTILMQYAIGNQLQLPTLAQEL